MSAGNLIKVVGIVIIIISILLGIAIGASAVVLAGILIGIFLIGLGLIICDTSNLNLQISELSTRLIVADKKNKEEINRITARDEAILALLTTIEQKNQVSTLTHSKFEYNTGDNTSHPRFEGEEDEEFKKRIANLN
ncbi:MAG: hypothetical protein GX903_10610 [Spirochaetales bacterium]|nr:hypothetical protein [Spirochaetales bacterium]